MSVILRRVGGEGDYEVVAGGIVREDGGEEKEIRKGQCWSVWRVLNWIDNGTKMELRARR